MLDSVTKRRIDSARDILVGKIPDPKSQVEQITIALIYKFMDDMDKESEALGGKKHFFIGDLETYSWTKLMSAETGGHQLLKLYSESFEKFQTSTNLPQLFRDIFKNAFLPYRDPETLRLFLKTINEFKYDHSEQLGNAFEYLLLVLGSQGDAGQFLTPRHIIDFIVECVDPQKEDRILDPACGTAGFLISAYKHILKQNAKDGKDGAKLLPDEKKKLLNDIVGYDISPDMVRLSRVNMYLHGFPTPQIAEYDTLTSEDKWAEYYDVIMANPPFMSPKGGIIPHQRFSVQAKRSEVLFVDYIAEHLLQNGRAGVIVPEGIIFQSGNAYKALRKMLVDNYLYAVVSLPAGVFNPYSGVKTSILLMDKRLARTTDSILFVKVGNDGFNLGAQRKEVPGSDLPEAARAINEFKKAILAGQSECKSVLGLVLKKSEIAANSDYNLSLERYRKTDTQCHHWPLVNLRDICQISTGNPAPQDENLFRMGKYPFYRTSDVGAVHISGDLIVVRDWLNEEGIKGLTLFKKGTILFPKSGASTFLNHRVIMGQDGYVSSHLATIYPNPSHALAEYIYRCLILVDAKELTADQSYPSLRIEQIGQIQIPLPPIPVQQEIVSEIRGYQKIIDGARQVVENYKPQIKVDPEWPMVELGDVSEVTSSKRILAEEYVTEGVPFYRTKEIVELSKEHELSLELFISRERYDSIKTRFGAPLMGDLLVSAVGTIGISWVVADEREFYFKDGNLLWIRNFSSLNSYFLKYCLDSTFADGIDHIVFGAAYKALTIEKLKKFKIPLPALITQRSIVAQIEKEQVLVASNKQLVEIYEQKIRDKIAEVWGAAE